MITYKSEDLLCGNHILKLSAEGWSGLLYHKECQLDTSMIYVLYVSVCFMRFLMPLLLHVALMFTDQDTEVTSTTN